MARRGSAEPAERYAALVRDFRWSIPPRFNIAEACCDRWAAAEPGRVALIGHRADGIVEEVTYGALKRASDGFAAALRARGIGRGDRVAVLLPQSRQAVAGHLAVYRLGGIVVPLAALFGVDALRYRLRASGARAVLTDDAGAGRIAAVRAGLPDLGTVFSVDGAAAGAEDFERAAATPAAPLAAETGPDAPAMLIFTSGTTGPPKGVLHGHRVLIGHLPGFSFTHDLSRNRAARFWTPSDWAWAGGLLNALLPALHHGIPVVFGPFRRFDPEAAFALMAEAAVTHLFVPPTAVNLMRTVREPAKRFALRLRSVGSAGERLGEAAFRWAEEALGLTINEFYGQTECNYVLGSSAALGVSRPGAAGKAIPGHTVAVIDAEGRPAPPGTAGEIAVRRPDPAMFLEYWKEPAATRDKFRGAWMLTGDEAAVDDDGYVRFVGRKDDIITSSGYRIGPGEIEDCLAGHPAVAMAAAVGKPDPVRTEIVKAFVVLKPGYAASEDLAGDLRRHVRERLSAAEYPREIAFVGEIPLTTTGKVIRRGFREQAVAEADEADAG